MPILSPIQRRSVGGRILIAAMYLLLVIGGAWMVYPFLLMLSGSAKSDVDIRHFDIVPRFLVDVAALFRRFEEQRYGGQLDPFTAATRYRDANGAPASSFEHLQLPAPANETLLKDWREFLADAREMPPHFFHLGHFFAQRTVSEIGLEYQKRLWTAFPNLTRYEVYDQPRWEDWCSRHYQPMQGQYAQVYEQMRRELPTRYFIPVSVEGFFITTYLKINYGSGAEATKRLNEKWATNYASIYDVSLPSSPPEHPAQREDWWAFVRDMLSVRFVLFAPTLQPAFHDFLREKYLELSALNKVYGTEYKSWQDVPFPNEDAAVPALSDAQHFLQTRPSPDGISLDSAEYQWRRFLRRKYNDSIAAANRAHGTTHASFDNAAMPLLGYDLQLMQENRGAIKWDFLTRNYRIAWNQLTIHGRAFQNTLIFCALNVVLALIVNPLAAYALSRYSPRWGFAALFLLMATMAFPGEVTQIPSFLMLRQLGWLNTFAALVIPAAAHGYSIFLLKGFFDSLPRELYESASMDGAGELRTFFQITLPMSAPILAVIALGAFTAAYGAFMFALLVCQDQSMWTLMVHIYQLQQDFGTPVIFAALVLAAIPTLLVFIFCQKIIMRGIVVPVEK
jgi:multiple sugar transport system permease protein